MRGKKARHLDILFGRELVGELSGHNGDLSFAYASSWLTGGFPLSFGLPLRDEPFSDDETRAYFGNLVPEERMLEMLAKAGKFSGRDLLSFFEIYGRECAGAISIGPPLPETELERDITDDLAKWLADNPGTGGLQLAMKTRISLGGAQDKLPCVFRDGKIFVPDGATTHILKPDIPGYPESARNEAFCLDLARKLGLPVAKSKLISLSGKDILVVKRYDRKDGKRLHQQDFCQALGLLSDYKYQGQGVFFGFPDMMEVCKKNGIDAGMFFGKAQIFNFLIANCDAHAKNFSLMLENDGWKPAPLYDLLCTAIYPGLDENMAMLFGGAWNRNDVCADDVKKAGDLFKIADYPAMARKMAKEALAALPVLIRRHSEEYGGSPVYGKMVKIIEKSCSKMLEMTKCERKPFLMARHV